MKNMTTFEKYCWGFYGPKQIYGDFFGHKLTHDQLRSACFLRQTMAANNFDGDSVDREAVRDILLAATGKLASI